MSRQFVEYPSRTSIDEDTRILIDKILPDPFALAAIPYWMLRKGQNY
ncbi:hypothetical protein VV11_014005 [Trichodesmium erythraeum 21-75]|nr:hypothetical protein [Trichodesmium erythraeum 21-75]